MRIRNNVETALRRFEKERLYFKRLKQNCNALIQQEKLAIKSKSHTNKTKSVNKENK